MAPEVKLFFLQISPTGLALLLRGRKGRRMTTVTVAEMDGALREFLSLDSKCPLHILIASRSAHPDCLLIASGLFLHPFPRAHTRAPAMPAGPTRH